MDAADGPGSSVATPQGISVLLLTPGRQPRSYCRGGLVAVELRRVVL